MYDNEYYNQIKTELTVKVNDLKQLHKIAFNSYEIENYITRLDKLISITNNKLRRSQFVKGKKNGHSKNS